ncbi:hypothetical protein CRG98_001153 [Punica granatum]|uniref:Uncharacterized protein n=1 Tax=Punica granatum TaxID=22663 RepID=A0A2I0LCN6_PUNGR|nr:hypothetical protein CRG98_001153 [Punica granatum]
MQMNLRLHRLVVSTHGSKCFDYLNPRGVASGGRRKPLEVKLKCRAVEYPTGSDRPDWVDWLQERHQLDGLDSAGHGGSA